MPEFLPTAIPAFLMPPTVAAPALYVPCAAAPRFWLSIVPIPLCPVVAAASAAAVVAVVVAAAAGSPSIPNVPVSAADLNAGFPAVSPALAAIMSAGACGPTNFEAFLCAGLSFLSFSISFNFLYFA